MGIFAALDFHSRELGQSSIDEKGTDTEGGAKIYSSELPGQRH